MLLREAKIGSLTVSSIPRASGLLQSKEVPDTSVQKQRKKTGVAYQQLHLLRRLLQNKFLRLDKLRDTAQSRSTLPPGRTTPHRLARCSRSRGGWAHNGTHHPFLGGRRGSIWKRSIKTNSRHQKVTVRTHLSLPPVEVVLRFWVLADSTDGSSAAPSRTSDAVRLADGPANKNQP